MRADFISNSDDYTSSNSHPDAERDRPSDAKSNADCDTASNSYGYTYGDTFTDSSAGLEYLDPVAGGNR